MIMLYEYAIPKIKMSHNLSCLESRFRLLCPISHNALDRIIYTIFPPFCQVIQSCSQAWKGHNDDDFVRPVLDSKFCSLLCFLNSS